MYLDHTFARKTFAQRIGSAKVKSPIVLSLTALAAHLHVLASRPIRATSFS